MKGSTFGIILIILVIVIGGIFSLLKQKPVINQNGDSSLNEMQNMNATDTTSSTENNTNISTNETKIDIKNFTFSPNKLTVKKGTKVLWTNSDGTPHTIDSDKDVFESQTLNLGDGFAYVFNEVGEFPYHCGIHTGMKGIIIVTE